MTTTYASLDGYFKERYADEVTRAVPNWALFQKKVPFQAAKRIGRSYNFPVVLRRSHGVTFNGSAPGTAFSLKGSRSLKMEEALVQGTEFVLREAVSYGAAKAALADDDASYGSALDEVVFGMTDTCSFYAELTCLHGGRHIGVIGSVTGGALTVSKATWAPGIWGGLENGLVDVYDPTYTTLRNDVGPLTVSAVDADTRIVTVTGDATDLAAITANDIIIPHGARGEAFAGLEAITSNTGSLFGINASTYNLWKANSFPVGGKLTMTKLMQAVNTAVVRGLQGNAHCYLSTYAWTDLNNDMASLRRYTENTKMGMDQGANELKFYGVTGGELTLCPHPMIMAGNAYVVPDDNLLRIGSTDTTFESPTIDGASSAFFQHMEDRAGVELRAYWDQALVSTQPAKLVRLTGIANDSL